MLYELALLMVAVPASYWGVLLVRRRAAPTFAWMLTATGAAGWIAYVARRNDGPAILDLVGAIAIGAGVCLLIVGPMMRRAARWAVATDRLRLAALLVDAGDVLQPGTSGPDDKATLAALRDVRAGEVDHAVAALRAAREKAPSDLHRAFDERIALLYVVAMRWDEAIAHAEATLFPTTPLPPAEDAQNVDVGRALGMSPPVWVELIAAYGRTGQLDRAASMAERFDRVARGATGMAWLLHRVRMVFLAAAGRVEPVRRLLAQTAPPQVRPSSRLYWSALAAERAGDRDAARADYRAALGHARRIPRVEAEIRRALDALDVAAPAALSPEAARIADDLASHEVVLPRPSRPALPHATFALVAANVMVAAITAIFVASPGDIGAVVRAGGNVRAAVDAGQWWRIATGTFVHVGWVHLIVNMAGLWSVGRMAESLFGHARMFAIYACAGLAGALASHAYGTAGVSAGASGAIFGLLGALIVELVVAGKRVPRPGRNALVGALVFVAIIQLGMGFLYSAIDQWQHAVGLAGGAAAGALLSTHGPAVRARLWIARAIAIAAAAAFAVAGAFAATTDYRDTLARYGRATATLNQVAIDAPRTWRVRDGKLDDPDHLGAITLALVTDPAEANFDAWRATARAHAQELGFQEVLAADDIVVHLPAGWSSSELIATLEDELGAIQRFRVVLFARAFGPVTVAGALYVPDVLARDAADTFADVIASARPDAKLAPAPAQR